MESSAREPLHLAAYSESSIFGGAEAALATLLECLDEEIEVTVAGTAAPVVERIAAARPGARTRSVRAVRDMRDVAGIVAHVRLVRELRPDVLQMNCGTPWTCQYALLAGTLTPRVRTLVIHHTAAPPIGAGQLRRSRFNLRRADAQVSIFTEGARVLERWIGLGHGAVRVIHNGAPDPPIEPLPRPTSGPVIGVVGALERRKGQDVLLRALPSLPVVTAVLVGEGRDRQMLEGMARELGVSDRVMMPGWQADPRPWLPTFDVFVMPSRIEGLPLGIVEAMLASRPVVASRVDGVPEAVIDGRTGFLVPPEDSEALASAVRSLLDDPDRAIRMGKEGRRFAKQNFRLDGMARKYEAVYGELCGFGLRH